MKDANWQLEWPLIGQDRVISFLEKIILANKIAQTYIFTGPSYLGKSSLSLAFARNLWRHSFSDKSKKLDISSLNSDLYVLERLADKKYISVEQAREFSKKLTLSSFFNSYKIGIIKEAHLMTPEAQNSLLKTLEEPRDKVLIILLTEDHNKLLPTILSRSQILHFYPVKNEQVYDYLLSNLEVKRSLAKEIAAASSGRPLQARRWAENPDLYQEFVSKYKSAFTFLKSDLSDRLIMIREVFPDKIDEQTLNDYLNIWESLWRDALLLVYDQKDKLCYPALSENWSELWKKRDSVSREEVILRALELIKKSRMYLRHSFNTKHVLENLAIYF